MSDQPVDNQVIRSEYTHQQAPSGTPPIVANVAPDGDGVFFALKHGYSVEQIAGARCHKRAHTFDDLRSFADYLNRHTAADPQRAEIVVGADRVTAALDPRNRIGDVVGCELAFDPRFAAWTEAAFHVKGKSRGPIAQRPLHSLLRAQQADFKQPQVGALALAAVRDLVIIKGGKQESRLDERGYYRIVGALNDRKIDTQLPGEFTLALPIFEGVLVDNPAAAGTWTPAVYEIDVLLSMDEANGEPVFELEAPALARILRGARRDAAAYLRSLLGPELLVGLGQFRLEDVAAFSTTDASSGLERLAGRVVRGLAAMEGGEVGGASGKAV